MRLLQYIRGGGGWFRRARCERVAQSRTRYELTALSYAPISSVSSHAAGSLMSTSCILRRGVDVVSLFRNSLYFFGGVARQRSASGAQSG